MVTGQPSTSRAHGLGRAGWNLADQTLSALTNFALTFIVARNVSADAFGQFSVAFLVFSLLIGVQRALIGTPLSMSHSKKVGAERVQTARAALGAVLWITLPVSLFLLLVGLFTTTSMRSLWITLAVVLPWLITQDACRLAFIAWGKPKLATVNDATWAVAQFTMVFAFLETNFVSAASMTLAWGLGATVAAILGMWQLRSLPYARAGLGWIRGNWKVSGYLLANYLLDVGTFQGGVLVFGSFLGVSDIGALRAAQVLTGPLGIIALAAFSFGVPEISRRGLPKHPMAIATVSSAGLAGVAIIYTAILLLIPTSLGTQMLGDTWAGASEVLLPVAVTSIISCAKIGPAILVYGLAQASKTFWLMVVLTTSAVVFMLTGATLFGVVGLAWGMAAAQAVVMPLWFVVARRAAAEHQAVAAIG